MPKVIPRLRAGLAQGMCWGLFIAGMSANATPDLIVNQYRLEGNVAVQTRIFASNDCAVVEGCTTAGTRRLLLFDVGLVNIGTGDLVIGNPADHPDLLHVSPCHGRYEFDSAAGYELLTTNGRVVTGRKQGFCFRDDNVYLTNAGPAKFTCDFQGLTIGWEDISDKSLDCQWLDITGVPCGDYILRVVANPDAIIHELDYNNNVAEVLISLQCSTNTPPPPPPPTCTNKPPPTCSNTPPTTCTNKPSKCVNHDDWSQCWDWKKLGKMCNGHYQKKCKIPNCRCKCHIPPGKPGKGGDNDHNGKGNGRGGEGDHEGKGNGKDCHKGDDHDNKGGGKGGHKGDDHGGKGNGKDCDRGDNGGGKGEGKGGGDDNDHGGKGQGKDCDKDDDHGKGGGKAGHEGDDHGGKGNGKDCDHGDNGGGKGGGKGDDDHGGKGKSGGNGKDGGNDKGGGQGKGGKNCK